MQDQKTSWVVETAPGEFTTIRAETAGFEPTGAVVFTNSTGGINLIMAYAPGAWLTVREVQGED